MSTRQHAEDDCCASPDACVLALWDQTDTWLTNQQGIMPQTTLQVGWHRCQVLLAHGPLVRQLLLAVCLC